MRLYVKRSLIALVMLAALGWSYGAVAFLRADGALTWTLPARARHPQEVHNLASYRFGPTLRASSFHGDEVAHHHPAFMIDEKEFPSLTEKWCSGIGDEAPWVEIWWHEPRQLSEVKIWHAGFSESAQHTVQRYRLACLGARSSAPTLEITSNERAIATHSLACSGARGLRIDWTPNVPGERARAYEIEAWGK